MEGPSRDFSKLVPRGQHGFKELFCLLWSKDSALYGTGQGESELVLTIITVLHMHIADGPKETKIFRYPFAARAPYATKRVPIVRGAKAPDVTCQPISTCGSQLCPAAEPVKESLHTTVPRLNIVMIKVRIAGNIRAPKFHRPRTISIKKKVLARQLDTKSAKITDDYLNFHLGTGKENFVAATSSLIEEDNGFIPRKMLAT
ncbi:hypothetical protein K449DRAFT_404244 [Hypoxylon sp. EC38]|nr:hypothetical protein K449DRAFT_404244 [Hypoxylon sp. EC38]